MGALWQWLWESSFYDAFAKDLRPGLFSGFLTISGFLYSAHTFIVVHMKKELYSSDSYRARVIERRKLRTDYSYYGPLRRLSRFLMASVMTSFVTSILQVTIGLHHANWTALLCVFMAGVSAILLFLSIVIMAMNLKMWFDDLEASEMVNGHPPKNGAATPAA